MNLKAYAKETLTVAATAVGFTAATYNAGRSDSAGARLNEAIFIVETAQIRYWMNGDDPTASVGLLGEIGDVITLVGRHDIENFKAIRTGSTSATLSAQFFTE